MNAADRVTPPRRGKTTILDTSTTAASLDLSTLDNQTVNLSDRLSSSKGTAGKYVRIKATTSDCWIVFNSSSTGLTSIDPTTTGANANNNCYPIIAGTYEDFFLERGVDLFMGYRTASGTGKLIIFASSGPEDK